MSLISSLVTKPSLLKSNLRKNKIGVLHVKSELDLGVKVRHEHFREPLDELLLRDFSVVV